MGKIGGNDPCPCCSGKKYKKCCQDKERDESKVVRLPAAKEKYISDDDSGVREVRDSDFDRFWDEFEKASFEDKLRLALDYIEGDDEFDGEIASEIMECLHVPLVQAGRFDEFERIIKRIEELRPEAYAEDAGWFNIWRADAALSQPGGDLETPLMALAENLDDKIFDPFFYLIDKLRYHGRVKELSTAMVQAWPKVKKMSGILPVGIEEFQNKAAAILIGEHLDSNPDCDCSNVSFLDQVGPLDGVTPEWLEKILFHYSGRSEREWTIEDFQTSDYGLLSKNLFLLIVDFSAFLHYRRGWIRSRSMLAQDEMYEYLSENFETALKGNKALSAKKAASALLPRPKSADKHLAEKLQFIFPQPYRAAAFGLALPAWLEFLAEKGLCEKEKSEIVRAELLEAIKPLPRILMVDDPELVSDVITRWGMDESEIAEPTRPVDLADLDESDFPLVTPGMVGELMEEMLAERRGELEDKALKPNTGLLPALKKLPAHWVEGICNQVGMLGLAKNKERLEALKERLPREDALVFIWSRLPEESRRMLGHILADEGGHASMQELSRRFGKDEDATWFWDEGQTPRTPLGLLRLHGLVFVGMAKVNKRRVKIAAVPVELRDGLSRILASPGAFDGAPPLPEPEKPVSLNEEDEEGFIFNDGISVEFLAEEEEVPFIAEFVESIPYSEHTRHNYEQMLEKVRGSQEEGSREIMRRILERMTESKYAAQRLSAYKEGYKEFGESFIRPALDDRAESVRQWAREIVDPRQGSLF